MTPKPYYPKVLSFHHQTLSSKAGHTMYVLFILLLSFLVGFTTPSNSNVETGTVTITLKNVEPNKGIMRVAIYQKKGFLDRNAEIMGTNDPAGSSSSQVTVFRNVPYGRYAVGSYQDVNGDWKLNSTMVGIPTETYGFSKVPGSKWRKPRFEEVAFDLNESNAHLTIELKKWGDY
jgi:uncharacterized protein (DUF2141 family)